MLTTFSKLSKQQLAKQLQTHFEGLFDDYRYVSAYRKGYSCQSVLLDLIDQWRTAPDNKFYIGALFMDLSKCLSMPHALLISKLEAYGSYFSGEVVCPQFIHLFMQNVMT